MLTRHIAHSVPATHSVVLLELSGPRHLRAEHAPSHHGLRDDISREGEEQEQLAEYLKWSSQPREEPTMEVARVSLRAAAVVVFLLATLGVAPVPMTPLGLALWCASTLLVS